MSRRNTQFPALIAARVLSQPTGSVQPALLRLSTGADTNPAEADSTGSIVSDPLRNEAGSIENNDSDSAIDSLDVAIENAKAAYSAVHDPGFAEVTSLLTRAQVLLQAASQPRVAERHAPTLGLSLLE